MIHLQSRPSWNTPPVSLQYQVPGIFRLHVGGNRVAPVWTTDLTPCLARASVYTLRPLHAATKDSNIQASRSFKKNKQASERTNKEHPAKHHTLSNKKKQTNTKLCPTCAPQPQPPIFFLAGTFPPPGEMLRC